MTAEEDSLFALALDEVTTKKGLDKAIWARALVDTKGNETEATAMYIAKRVEAMAVKLEEAAAEEAIHQMAGLIESLEIVCPSCEARERLKDLNLREASSIYLSNVGRIWKGLEVRSALCLSCESGFEWVANLDGSFEYFGVRVTSKDDLNSYLNEADNLGLPAANKIRVLRAKRTVFYYLGIWLSGDLGYFGLTGPSFFLAYIFQFLFRKRQF